MASASQPPAAQPARRPTVLVVDDHEDTQAAWALFLGRRGFSVEVAGDGRQGRELALASRPDVILLDLVLPVLSGVDLARELKARSETKDIPIIAVTGWGRERALQAGCDGYVPKPCVLDDVLVEIRRVLAAAGRPDAGG
jgi:DNA-binding response OmpR family regulator